MLQTDYSLCEECGAMAEQAIGFVGKKGQQVWVCKSCIEKALQSFQHSVQSDCCPRCGANDWRYAIAPDTLEICNVCGNSR